MNVQKLEDYFLDIFPEIISPDESLSLLYLVADIRPGALIMSAQNRDLGPIKDFSDIFGLKTRFFHSVEDVFDDKGLFIAKTEERFQILEESEGSFYGCSDIDVGRFLGYNLEAAKYYEENFRAGMEYRDKVSELIDEGKITSKETAYLNLICYVPIPEEENILRAVARGKKRERKLREFDERHGTNVGNNYIEKMLKREKEQY